MRIDLISDICANLPAFEAVLDDMPPVDDIIFAGDVVVSIENQEKKRSKPSSELRSNSPTIYGGVQIRIER